MDWKTWKPKKQELTEEWDVIAIGSGLGALMCCANLAKAGQRCLVLDQHYVAGGYAHHFPRKHKGEKYWFDVALHQTGSLRNGHFMKGVLGELGVIDDIEPVEAETIYRSRFGDFEIVVPQDLEKFRALMKEHFPAEARGIDRYIEIMMKIPKEVRLLQEAKGKSPIEQAQAAPIAMKYMVGTLEDVFNDTVEDPLLRAILAQLWGYMGLPPGQVSAILWAMMWTSYHLGGCFNFKGGGQALSNSFCRVVEDGGGAVKLRTMVEGVLFEDDGRVCGVRTAKGEEFRAPVIVSNASTIDTFNKLVPRKYVPDDLLNRINTLPISSSIIQAYVGIDGDAAELGLSDHEFFLNAGIDYDAEWAAVKRGDTENVSVLIGNHSGVNPDAAPKGKSVVEAAMLAVGEHWIGLPEEEYEKKKADITELLLDRLAEAIPDIRHRVEVIEVGTPKTMQDYSMNPGGAIYGYESGKATHTVFRPEQRTPVPGLYLASAWTFPGPGFGGAMTSGYFAAKTILEDQKKAAKAEEATVGASA